MAETEQEWDANFEPNQKFVMDALKEDLENIVIVVELDYEGGEDKPFKLNLIKTLKERLNEELTKILGDFNFARRLTIKNIKIL